MAGAAIAAGAGAVLMLALWLAVPLAVRQQRRTRESGLAPLRR
jgi:hypothetical protein